MWWGELASNLNTLDSAMAGEGRGEAGIEKMRDGTAYCFQGPVTPLSVPVQYSPEIQTHLINYE